MTTSTSYLQGRQAAFDVGFEESLLGATMMHFAGMRKGHSHSGTLFHSE